jgi:hypothetical protein
MAKYLQKHRRLACRQDGSHEFEIPEARSRFPFQFRKTPERVSLQNGIDQIEVHFSTRATILAGEPGRPRPVRNFPDSTSCLNFADVSGKSGKAHSRIKHCRLYGEARCEHSSNLRIGSGNILRFSAFQTVLVNPNYLKDLISLEISETRIDTSDVSEHFLTTPLMKSKNTDCGLFQSFTIIVQLK